ncbi:MAG: recombinase family protein [Mycobacteriaceae bacterium]
MTELEIGYARVSTVDQDLTAQRDALTALGVDPERIYVDHGLTRPRPGQDSRRHGRRESERVWRDTTDAHDGDVDDERAVCVKAPSPGWAAGPSWSGCRLGRLGVGGAIRR